ncbi:sortase B [Dethiosulfatibacter aminovorans DSM 17477]|uniref:Sortase B n=1 Tax=Dethiosulfatibacter aminovorans DSM 17477 TaxID=1121476 RepID=A0A1M6G9M2_9FIRM|nr:class B sortase [Dethiosulfatibacter aminovorans]SHJ06618.1 sortase B [Dethiosulfatibacter aminovorans DSM 17477]
MNRNRIVTSLLFCVFLTFIGLAVNEFFKYGRSTDIYEEAKEQYYEKKELSVELDGADNTSAPQITTDADIAVTTDATVVEDNGSDNEGNNTTVTPIDDGGVSEEVKQTAAEAGEVIGWVRIPGTGIDYPVVQTTDNEFYLTHNYKGDKDVKGAIYMDFRNDGIGDDRNYILYGHKMIDGSMFSDLVYYVQDGSYERYFYNYNTVKYDDYEEETEWKIFSVYVVDLDKEDYYLYTNYSDDEKYQAFIDRAYRRSLLDSDIEVTLEDEIMTLVTCSFWYENSRVIIHAVRQ